MRGQKKGYSPDSFNLGVSTELLAASMLIELEYSVLLPFDRRGKYDLVLFKNNIYEKVQVKRATWRTRRETVNRYLEVMCSSHGVKYTRDEVDCFVFCDDKHRLWKVPIEELINKTKVVLDKEINSTRSWKTKSQFDAEKWRLL